MFQRRDKHLRLTNQTIQRLGGHAPRTRLLLSPSRLGHVRRDPTKTRATKPEDSSSSSSLHLLSVSPLCHPLHSASPPTERWLIFGRGHQEEELESCDMLFSVSPPETSDVTQSKIGLRRKMLLSTRQTPDPELTSSS
ncbi:hypothetical protein PAMP_009866 [Pampus punctatissimus]